HGPVRWPAGVGRVFEARCRPRTQRHRLAGGRRASSPSLLDPTYTPAPPARVRNRASERHGEASRPAGFRGPVALSATPARSPRPDLVDLQRPEVEGVPLADGDVVDDRVELAVGGAAECHLGGPPLAPGPGQLH